MHCETDPNPQRLLLGAPIHEASPTTPLRLYPEHSLQQSPSPIVINGRVTSTASGTVKLWLKSDEGNDIELNLHGVRYIRRAEGDPIVKLISVEQMPTATAYKASRHRAGGEGAASSATREHL